MLNPYLNIYTRVTFPVRILAGIGDTQIRLKVNFWGNDGGRPRSALARTSTFPTAYDGLSKRNVEGGLIVPFTCNSRPISIWAQWRNSTSHRNGRPMTGTAWISSTQSRSARSLPSNSTSTIEYVGIAPIQTGRTYLAYFGHGCDLRVDGKRAA